ncbi:Ead domain protein [Klebsiella pneumoniae]|nr:Ead domain protein [Klebsiella pneumoniae]
MTDITELAQRMKAAAVRAKTATEEYASGHMSVSVCYAECEEFNRLTDGPDNILALVEALESEKRICATWRKTAETNSETLEKAQAAEPRWHRVASRVHEQACESDVKIDELEAICAAAEKLVRCKGRYHSEQNYRALAALFGVKTPNLPPLDRESRTVTLKQYDEFQICHYGATEDYAKGYIDCQNNFSKWLAAAGIKVEAE